MEDLLQKSLLLGLTDVLEMFSREVWEFDRLKTYLHVKLR